MTAWPADLVLQEGTTYDPITADDLAIKIGAPLPGADPRSTSQRMKYGYIASHVSIPGMAVTDSSGAVKTSGAGTSWRLGGTPATGGTYQLKLTPMTIYSETMTPVHTATVTVKASATPTVTPSPPTFTDNPHTVTLPPVTGGQWRIDGKAVDPGTYDEDDGPTLVTLDALPGYKLGPNMTYRWEHTHYTFAQTVTEGEHVRLPAEEWAKLVGAVATYSGKWAFLAPFPPGLIPTSGAPVRAIYGVVTEPGRHTVTMEARDGLNVLQGTSSATLTVKAADGSELPPKPEPEPKDPDPKDPEPKDPDPKDPDPKDPDPKDPDPKDPDPKDPDPKDPDPKDPEPKDPDPKDPDPKDPEPTPTDPDMALAPLYDKLAQRACRYIGRDPGTLDAPSPDVENARNQVEIVLAFVYGYTRGHGFGADGAPNTALQIVVVSALSRLVQNPEQVSYYSVTDYTEKGAVLNGWTLPERYILNNYRRTWA